MLSGRPKAIEEQVQHGVGRLECSDVSTGGCYEKAFSNLSCRLASYIGVQHRAYPDSELRNPKRLKEHLV